VGVDDIGGELLHPRSHLKKRTRARARVLALHVVNRRSARSRDGPVGSPPGQLVGLPHQLALSAPQALDEILSRQHGTGSEEPKVDELTYGQRSEERRVGKESRSRRS